MVEGCSEDSYHIWTEEPLLFQQRINCHCNFHFLGLVPEPSSQVEEDGKGVVSKQKSQMEVFSSISLFCFEMTEKVSYLVTEGPE